MKRILATIAVLTFAGLQNPASAALGIDIAADRRRYVRYEPINLTIRLRNDTGNVLDFGANDRRVGHLKLEIRDGEGNPARATRDPNHLVDHLRLPAGASKHLTLALNNYFALTRQADYTVHAEIGHSRLSHDYRSNRLTLEVRNAFPVWERKFGLPGHDEDQAIVNRKASLLRFQEKDGEIYCLRIEDDNYVYSIQRIARHIIGARPRGDVDAIGNIHIFIRIKSRIFMHQAYDHQGELKQERYYTFDNSAPTLFRDQRTGTMQVIGGRPAIRGVDYAMPEDVEGTIFEDSAPVLEPL